MIFQPIDPYPRTYPPFVTPMRRGQFDLDTLGALTHADVENWLLGEAADQDDLLALYQEFVWRLIAAGLPLHRASLHVGTLHPEIFGYAWNWERSDGFCDEVKVDEGSLQSDSYKRNPLFQVIEYGKLFRAPIATMDEPALSPLLRDLKKKGLTDYAAIPLRAVGRHHNAATVATQQAGGFTETQFDEINRHLKMLALHVQRHIALRISVNTLTTYLGKSAGDQVLRGSIKRGSGAPIDAVIWASDLRGFTKLADRLSDQDIIAVLNAYFEQLAGAVLNHGGEVLKFIGDGLLAVFPFAEFESEKLAASAGLAAAQAALEGLEKLNDNAAILPHITSWRPLRTGIALHRGEVFFGNLGAPKRLDFTVIGKAVNATSRIETLCKDLNRSVLLSQAVAGLLDAPLDHLGRHKLRGLTEPLAIFSPKTL